MTEPGAGPPLGVQAIRLGIFAFVATCILLFVFGSRLKPPRESDPGYAVSERARAQTDGTFVVTLDVKSRDHWVPFNLGTGQFVPSEEQADLLIRRAMFRAPGGAQNLGTVPLDQARWIEGAWTLDVLVDGSLQNPALSDWYDYSRMTHLLYSRKETFALRRSGGAGLATLQIESYYCKPEGSGCMTLRYRLGSPDEPAAAGSR